MDPTSWEAWYKGDGQSVYALLVVPLLFLGYRLWRGRPGAGLRADAARFVDGYAIAFTFETLVDPVATGPLLRALDLATGAASTAVQVLFVLLGDFRVYLLVFALLAIAAGRRWQSALPAAIAATFVVPVTALAGDALLHRAIAGLGAMSIWMVYEALFIAVALLLRAWITPERASGDGRLAGYLRGLLLYVAGYYALWFSADVLIQIGGFDVGWLLRALPNQLYYAWWVPAVFFAFFVRR